MNSINNVAEIIRSSVQFDKSYKTRTFCDLKKYDDMINSLIDKLPNVPEFSKIIEKCEGLNKINKYIINKILPDDDLINPKPELDTNLLLFFYNEDCSPSLKFMSEWKKIKALENDKFLPMAINCTTSKYDDICNVFNVYEYPMIKFVTPEFVYDYIGEFNADEIIRRFSLQ